MKIIVYIVFVLSIALPSSAQIYGCTDIQASNYNSSATQNDGSCIYPYTSVTPTHMAWLNTSATEISGHTFIGQYLWAHNDGGNSTYIYKVDTSTGLNIDSINLAPLTNYDWEDMTSNDTSVFIGDFGNNDGTRQNLKIYRMNKQDILSGLSVFNVDIIEFTYPNQSTFLSDPKTNFDCEAFIAFKDSLYLFSKNWGDFKTHIYRLPNQPGSYTAELIDSFNVNGLITSAAVNRMNNKIALLGYDTTGNSFVWVLWNYTNRNMWSGNKRRLDFGFAGGQAEGIDFIDTNRLLISNEKYSFFNQRLASINISALFDINTYLKNNKNAKEYQIIQSNHKLYIQSKRMIQAIEIFSMNGEKKLHDKVAKQMKKIDLIDFVPGKYLIRMFYDNKVSVSELFLVN